MTINATFISLEEMQKFAESLVSLNAVVESTKQEVHFSTGEEKAKSTPDTKEPAEVEVEDPKAAEAEETTYTIADARGKLAELQKAGKKDKVKQILESFGASKLTEVDAKNYAALIQKAGE